MSDWYAVGRIGGRRGEDGEGVGPPLQVGEVIDGLYVQGVMYDGAHGWRCELIEHEEMLDETLPAD